MAWCRSGDKPLFELMMVSLLMHICVTRPQWVNILSPEQNDWYCIYCKENLVTLKGKCLHFDEIFITGCTESCQNDNFQCSQWWKFRQNDDISLSVYTDWSFAGVSCRSKLTIGHFVFRIMASYQTGDKPLPEQTLTQICIWRHCAVMSCPLSENCIHFLMFDHHWLVLVCRKHIW